MVEEKNPPEPPHIQVLFSEMEQPSQKKIHSVFRKLLSDMAQLDEQKRFDELARKLKNHMERSTKSRGWSCIIGNDFSAAFAYDLQLAHHFLVDGHAVLLFQSQ